MSCESHREGESCAYQIQNGHDRRTTLFIEFSNIFQKGQFDNFNYGLKLELLVFSAKHLT